MFGTGIDNDYPEASVHGKMYEAAARGRLFSVCNQSPVSTTAALATTFTGLAIANPAGSRVNLVIRRAMVSQQAVGAAASIGLMVGAGAAAGALTPVNARIGGPASLATASEGATIATPVLYRLLGSLGSLATTGYGLQPPIDCDLDGSLVIPPGFYLASYTGVATTTALRWCFVWEETQRVSSS